MALDMDIATAELILRIQLDDIMTSKRELHDLSVHVALDAQAKELHAALTAINDQRIARDLARSTLQNQREVRRAIGEEEQAIRDHELAREAAGEDGETYRQALAKRVADDGAAVINELDILSREANLDEKAVVLFIPKNSYNEPEEPATAIVKYNGPTIPENDCDCDCDYHYDCDVAGEPSNSLVKFTGKGKQRADYHECCVCQEEYKWFQGLELSCEPEHHFYCRGCLSKLYESSLKDLTLFPPRCCRQEISLQDARDYLSKPLVQRYEEKVLELSTPNPTYCSDSSCLQFIHPNNVRGDVATCRACDQQTCVTCKRERHTGLCPEDPNTQSTMDMANANSWKQCPKCRTMIELASGCNHISCLPPCGHEFCYVCSAQWHTCTCPLWDEQRLLEHRIDAGHVPQPIAVAPLVEQYQECRHDLYRWRHMQRAHSHNTLCDMCRRVMPSVNRCGRCGDFQACLRCFRNRRR